MSVTNDTFIFILRYLGIKSEVRNNSAVQNKRTVNRHF